MNDFEIFLAALFVSVAGLNALARWLDGARIRSRSCSAGWCSGSCRACRRSSSTRTSCSLIFLPPLLYAAAFFSDLRALRDRPARDLDARDRPRAADDAGSSPCSAHEVIGLSWPMAFALGAIVSPTDPVAATAIMRRLGAPRRLVNVIEGESLVNDATALVAYRVAVAAAVGGTSRRSTPGSSSSARRRAESRSGWPWGSWSPRSASGSTTRPPRSRSRC